MKGMAMSADGIRGGDILFDDREVSSRSLRATRRPGVLTIDRSRRGGNNAVMQAIDLIHEIDADAQAVIESAMTGKPLDAMVRRRIREQSERATAAMREKYGTVEIAVDLVRQTREGA
jgi:hypothetical protein